jgi:hypothetical protein
MVEHSTEARSVGGSTPSGGIALKEVPMEGPNIPDGKITQSWTFLIAMGIVEAAVIIGLIKVAFKLFGQ